MLFNPRDNHACEQVGGWALDYRCINIKEEVMKGLIDEICGKEYLPEFFQTVVFHCEYVPLLKEVHELIIKESVDFEKEEKLLFLIEPLIDKYANLICESYQDNNKFITKVCDFIEKNYFKAIKLDELSEIADMNKYSLLRAFTKTRGITPYQYLQTIRIDKAKGFLEDGQEVIDVALKTGFTDQSHFTNFYKKFIGITPGQYRDIFKEH